MAGVGGGDRAYWRRSCMAAACPLWLRARAAAPTPPPRAPLQPPPRRNFRLFLHTKLSNPHYPPEIQAETTLINFTVTEQVGPPPRGLRTAGPWDQAGARGGRPCVTPAPPLLPRFPTPPAPRAWRTSCSRWW
jgi:hypothetical protein